MHGKKQCHEVFIELVIEIGICYEGYWVREQGEAGFVWCGERVWNWRRKIGHVHVNWFRERKSWIIGIASCFNFLYFTCT